MMVFLTLVTLKAEPKIDVTFSADRIRLSDRIRVEISIAGPAPIIVTPPANWLDEESMAQWSIRPVGEPSIASVAGNERWTQTLELSPFAVGEGVAIGWSPVVVRSGGDGEDRALTLPMKSIFITTDVTLTSEPRPLAGFLEAESVNREAIVRWPWGIAACVVMTLILVWLIRLRHRTSIVRVPISLINISDHRAWLDKFAESTPRGELTSELWRKIDELRFGNADISQEELAAFRRVIESLPSNQPLHQ